MFAEEKNSDEDSDEDSDSEDDYDSDLEEGGAALDDSVCPKGQVPAGEGPIFLPLLHTLPFPPCVPQVVSQSCLKTRCSSVSVG